MNNLQFETNPESNNSPSLKQLLNDYRQIEINSAQVIKRKIEAIIHPLSTAQLGYEDSDFESILADILSNKEIVNGYARGCSLVLDTRKETNTTGLSIPELVQTFSSKMSKVKQNYQGETFMDTYVLDIGEGFFIELLGYNLNNEDDNFHILKFRVYYQEKLPKGLKDNSTNTRKSLLQVLDGSPTKG